MRNKRVKEVKLLPCHGNKILDAQGQGKGSLCVCHIDAHARHCVSVDCKEVRAPEALQDLFGRAGAYLE